MLVCDDVLHWAATYDGPPFHALLCDPPYHLISDTRNGSPRNPGTGPYGRIGISTNGKGFMGTDWDGGSVSYQAATWHALAQHLLPGAFGMCFGSARGWHRLACAIEDAGMILHPSVFMLGWSYAQGWPKATRIDTAIDKAAGVEQEVVGYHDSRSDYDGCERTSASTNTHWRRLEGRDDISDVSQKRITAPATALAKVWSGHRYGRQMLKPALEPIIVWQKPYEGKPVESIVATGAGALWIDGARIAGESWGSRPAYDVTSKGKPGGGYGQGGFYKRPGEVKQGPNNGRWPPNLVLLHHPACQPLGARPVAGDPRGECHGTRPGGFGNVGAPNGSHEPNARVYGEETVLAYACVEACAVRQFDAQAGRPTVTGARSERSQNHVVQGTNWGTNNHRSHEYTDAGPASRFYPTPDWSLNVAEQLTSAGGVFYAPKASPSERDEGLTHVAPGSYPKHNSDGRDLSNPHNLIPGGARRRVERGEPPRQPRHNPHPTVKNLSLCQWLATLLAPPAAYAPRRLLCPFAGVASEMIGAVLSHHWEEVVGIEQDPTYAALGRQRLAYWTTQIAAQLSLFPGKDR